MTIFGHTASGGQLFGLISVAVSLAAPRNIKLFQAAIGQWIASSFHEGVSKMPLLNLVVALIVVGMALWLINRYIPMASSIKTILNVVVVVAVGVFVLQSVGLWNEVTHFRVG